MDRFDLTWKNGVSAIYPQVLPLFQNRMCDCKLVPDSEHALFFGSDPCISLWRSVFQILLNTFSFLQNIRIFCSNFPIFDHSSMMNSMYFVVSFSESRVLSAGFMTGAPVMRTMSSTTGSTWGMGQVVSPIMNHPKNKTIFHDLWASSPNSKE